VRDGFVSAHRLPLNPALVSFVLGDAQALHFDAEFDLAFSNSTLHWVPDQPATRRQLLVERHSSWREVVGLRVVA
jgi:trans-aconitate methyltransferase